MASSSQARAEQDDSSETPHREALNRLTVAQLKARCTEEGLLVSGSNQVLISRLVGSGGPHRAQAGGSAAGFADNCWTVDATVCEDLEAEASVQRFGRLQQGQVLAVCSDIPGPPQSPLSACLLLADESPCLPSNSAADRSSTLSSHWPQAALLTFSEGQEVLIRLSRSSSLAWRFIGPARS